MFRRKCVVFFAQMNHTLSLYSALLKLVTLKAKLLCFYKSGVASTAENGFHERWRKIDLKIQLKHMLTC